MVEIITAIVGNYFVTFFVLGLLFAAFSLMRKPKPLKKGEAAEAYFSYYMLISVGISNIVNFIFHVFFGELSVKFIGWAQSPFQLEVGFASLGVGIAGIIAFKASFPFRSAALITPVCFSLGAAGGHIYQMIVANNYSPGNVGLVLPADIIIPTVGLIFLRWSYKNPLTGKENQKVV
jgi:hypothetical protein